MDLYVKFDVIGNSETIHVQAAFRVHANGDVAAHGTLLVRDAGMRGSAVYRAATGDSSASCADTNENGIAGLTGFSIEFVSVRNSLATVQLSSTLDEIDQRGKYPITFRIEGDGIDPHFGEGTLQVAAPRLSKHLTR